MPDRPKLPAPPDIPQEDRTAWLPWRHPVRDRYSRDLDAWHGSIQFLGFGNTRQDVTRPADIDSLFIPPYLSENWLLPRQVEGDYGVKEGGPLPLLEVLRTQRRLVLLGDPGSGKSTLINWLCVALTRSTSGPLRESLGDLIPIPMILREMDLSEVYTGADLLTAWLQRPVAAAWVDQRPLFDTLAEKGQLLFLLDGLDEVGDLSVRESLREAVHDLHHATASHFLLTSRLVGYEACPFHYQRKLEGVSDDRPHVRKFYSDPRALPLEEKERLREYLAQDFDDYRSTETWFALRYLAPFDDSQVRGYTQRWFSAYDPQQSRARELAGRFLRDIGLDSTPQPSDPRHAMRELARTPILLMLMGLVYRADLTLPTARHLLYGEVVHAYLQTIPLSRGLRGESLFSEEELTGFLAAVAWQAQHQRCAEDDKASADRDILLTAADLTRWLSEAMEKTVAPADLPQVVASLIRYLTERAGLILPRGVDQEGQPLYAFLHLSFQEYFAARWLHEAMKGSAWLKRNRLADTDRGPASLHTLRQAATDPRWHEVLLLLLILSGPGDALERYTGLFADPQTADCDDPTALAPALLTGLVRSAEENAECPSLDYMSEGKNEQVLAAWQEKTRPSAARAALATAAALHPYVQLSRSTREAAFTAAWAWLCTAGSWDRGLLQSVSIPLTTPGEFTGLATTACDAVLPASPATHLDLRGCQSLTALPALPPSLRGLDLSGCQSLTALPALPPSLEGLDLTGCKSLTALPALPTSLRALYLSGCKGLQGKPLPPVPPGCSVNWP